MKGKVLIVGPLKKGDDYFFKKPIDSEKVVQKAQELLREKV
ncbi:MAG: hypothetical protein V1838_05035 [Patescibacteria group bacterium]